MLTQFLDWLDEAAGGLIRLAYLAAGVTAVAIYFGAGQLPPWLDHPLNAALPWALAFALETHTYLTARRVRAAWQDRAWGPLKVHLIVLGVLLAFSAWNQLGYLDGVWTPPTSGPLALPTWLAYAVRALIVPAAFMAAAFLAPLAPPITARIEGEARATLADVFKIARRQRKRMLKDAERSGRDLTSALVDLVPDEETRRIIGHAYAAIRTPEASVTRPRAASIDAQAEQLRDPGELLNAPQRHMPPDRLSPDRCPDTPPDTLPARSPHASWDTPPDTPQDRSRDTLDTSLHTPPGRSGDTSDTFPSISQDRPRDTLDNRVSSDLKTPSPDKTESGVVTPFTTPETTRSRTISPAVRRGRKPEALRRRDRDAREALEAQRRQRAFAMLERDPDASAAAIARTLRCRHRTAASYRAAWERQRLRVTHDPVVGSHVG